MKKAKTFKPIMLAVLLLHVNFLFSQTNEIKVTVTDASANVPLQNASVIVKSTKAGASTNSSGVAVINATPDDVLEISSVGYLTETVKVGSQKEISVSLIFSSITLPDVVLVGTRSTGRIKTETPVPVDVIPLRSSEISSGRSDLTSLINYAAPSLNYNKQSGSDGADHIDLATLRGLGPDQTLVLINGKRRHQTAYVTIFATRGRGNSGTDMNAIPISAIDKVEILRDGASAQYGSDAIAGVINLVLKKTVKELTADVSYGGYYDNKFNPAFEPGLKQYVYDGKFDGKALNLNLNYGIPIGKKGGFINLSGTYSDIGKTYRQVLDTTDLFNNDETLPTNIYRRAHGDASMKGGGGFFNAEFPVNENKTTFYAFGGGNYKSSDSYAFTRNWSARPERFPTDADGNMIFVPGIMLISIEGPFASADTFFNPHIQTKITDLSVALGVRGQMKNNWHWDISNSIGRNDFHFYGDKTFNASLGADKTHFDDGGFSFLQNTFNVNFDKKIETVAKGMNLALGAEYRFENYQLYAGEKDSYSNYDEDKATGSQGFPGYQPSDEADETRSTVGTYFDVELDATEKFLIAGAVRLENYSDFGFTHNYKLAMRYKIANNFNLRGSGSTGFRAPSLQQINFSSTFTTVQGGTIAEVKIAPNDNAITRAAGIPELKQEKSINCSFGFTFKPVDNLNISIDGYWVQIKDRVVLSGQFDASDPTLDPQLTTALTALNVSLAQFFANAVNTTNRGIDFVADYKKVWSDHSFRFMLTGNIQEMEIDKINVPAKLNDTEDHRKTFLTDREQAFILASAPKAKGGILLEYGIRKFTIGTRLTYFGKVRLLGYGDTGLGIDPMVPTDLDENIFVPDEFIFNGKLVTDLYISYKFSKHFMFHLGADNLLNIHPDFSAVKSAKWWAYNNETGGPWDSVQMGGNGRHYFAKASFTF